MRLYATEGMACPLSLFRSEKNWGLGAMFPTGCRRSSELFPDLLMYGAEWLPYLVKGNLSGTEADLPLFSEILTRDVEGSGWGSSASLSSSESSRSSIAFGWDWMESKNEGWEEDGLDLAGGLVTSRDNVDITESLPL